MFLHETFVPHRSGGDINDGIIVDISIDLIDIKRVGEFDIHRMMSKQDDALVFHLADASFFIYF